MLYNIVDSNPKNITIEISQLNNINSIYLILLGSCAGIMEHMGVYPLDTLKVRINQV